MSLKLAHELALRSVNKTLVSQSEALSILSRQYQQCAFSRSNLLVSLDILHSAVAENHGKIIICGIGKSFKIAAKLVATLNSLSIHSAVLHPSEALHGDLGIIKDGDCLVFLTASGNTPELINLLPHISSTVPIVLLTCTRDSKLSQHPQVKSLLYAELPSHLKEDTIHGLPAPTVSTTLSLALADATILALAELIEDDMLKRRKLFSVKHPGGSIGADLSHLNGNVSTEVSQSSSEKQWSRVSSSSCLSLDNIRSMLHSPHGSTFTKSDSMNSSTATSDDEESKLTPSIGTNRALSLKLKTSQSYQVCRFDMNEFLQLSDADFFKSISLYDYMVLKQNSCNLALECSRIRSIAKLEVGAGYTPEAWTAFLHGLVKDFNRIDL